MKEFIINNWDTILLLIWWIISFLWWIKQYYSKQKQEVEIEKLKTQLELQKNQKLLNDKKFREWYEKFINLLFDVLNKKSNDKQMKEWIIDFIKTSLLFSSAKTIKTFWLYRKESSNENSTDILIYMENLIKEMRNDLWVGNEDLDKFDILQTFIIWDIKKEINK